MKCVSPNYRTTTGPFFLLQKSHLLPYQLHIHFFCRIEAQSLTSPLGIPFFRKSLCEPVDQNEERSSPSLKSKQTKRARNWFFGTLRSVFNYFCWCSQATPQLSVVRAYAILQNRPEKRQTPVGRETRKTPQQEFMSFCHLGAWQLVSDMLRTEITYFPTISPFCVVDQGFMIILECRIEK